MNNPTFLIMDSGVGGLSVVQEIQHRIPHCHICYLADNAAFPYGTQDETVLVERLMQLLPGLERQYNPDIIVIACNTASTIVLQPLREQTQTPIIGVVPAIKPAASLSQTKQLALLATPGTVARHYTQQLIESFASNCQVIKLGSNELVHQAENKLRGLPIDQASVAKILAPLTQPNCQIDTLILGCTHFPFLRQEIKRHIPDFITVIDSGEAIARRALQLLENIPNRNRQPEPNYFLFTAEDEHAHALEMGIKHLGFSKIQFISDTNTEITQKSGAS